MTMPELWWNPPITPKFSSWCPCGHHELKTPYEWAIGVCDQCRKTAKKKPRKGGAVMDFIDRPLPGIENVGKVRRDVVAQKLATMPAHQTVPDRAPAARTGGRGDA